MVLAGSALPLAGCPQDRPIPLFDTDSDADTDSDPAGDPPVETATFDTYAGYVAACEAVLGPVPELTCQTGTTVVPVTATTADGTVRTAESSADLLNGRCDRPSVGGCGAGTRLGRVDNEQGTHFVYGCRNYDDDPAIDQINVVATDPGSGVSCFFSTRHRDNAYGTIDVLPHPGSDATVPGSDEPFWYTYDQLLGSPCNECHDNDALLRNPWVMQVDVVPEPDPLRPYRLVGADLLRTEGQWHPPEDIVHADTAPCRACHRLSAGYSGCFMAQSAGGRVQGLRTDAYASWPESVWMPHPEWDDPDALLALYPDQTAYEAAFGPALDALEACCSDDPPSECFLQP